MVLLVCYRRCSTCAALERLLERKGVPYAYREIDRENPDAGELAQWKERSGLPIRRFFNTSGQKYRQLGLRERLPGLPEEEQLKLLASDGLLVKRPILVTEAGVLVGRDALSWAEGLPEAGAEA